MVEFLENVAILIGTFFYLFGFAISAIITIISLVQIILERNLKGFLLLTFLFGLIIPAYIFFGFEKAISFIAIMMILLSARILVLDKPKSKTLAICICVMSFAALTLIVLFYLQNQSENIIGSLLVFIFMLMTPAILARLSIRSFSKKA